MPSKTIKTPLVVDRYFHIYNRGNNLEKLFWVKEDYEFFMKKYSEIIHPFVNTYAYCLLPNHFHFLIKVDHVDPQCWNHQPSHLFRKFFQFYAIWFNKKRNRKGSLFTKYYRRIEVSSDEYMKRLIYYIHRNPVKHGISSEFQTYPYSSFKSYSCFEDTIISRAEALVWFNNDLIEFLEYHKAIEEKPDLRDLIFDEA